MNKITFEDVYNNAELKTYINKGNDLLGVLGYTDHSEAHTMNSGDQASDILLKLGYSERTAELARISGYIHDMGNMLSRVDHAQTGALMAFIILRELGMDHDELADVVSAVGNHDENAGMPINALSAALIIADKSDVRRSRVRNKDKSTFDIHDRVNYAVINSALTVLPKLRQILLEVQIDTAISSVMDFFEIFLTRMSMCKRAADFLSAQFRLRVNNSDII
ncbi:MAG: HD domain-containing protein [Clostridiales bacterium]|jgi:metal-dependent HD superfamily phosphatase/phosphodiesterase|nr:HD domain-containing protein [Clostridiales bacterium]